MIFYGKTFSGKVTEAKGRQYDRDLREARAEIARLQAELEDKKESA